MLAADWGGFSDNVRDFTWQLDLVNAPVPCTDWTLQIDPSFLPGTSYTFNIGDSQKDFILDPTLITTMHTSAACDLIGSYIWKDANNGQ